MREETYLDIDFTGDLMETLRNINECIRKKSVEYNDTVLKQLVEDFDWLIKQETLTTESEIARIEQDSYYEGFEDGKDEVWEEAYDEGYEAGRDSVSDEEF